LYGLVWRRPSARGAGCRGGAAMGRWGCRLRHAPRAREIPCGRFMPNGRRRAARCCTVVTAASGICGITVTGTVGQVTFIVPSSRLSPAIPPRIAPRHCSLPAVHHEHRARQGLGVALHLRGSSLTWAGAQFPVAVVTMPIDTSSAVPGGADAPVLAKKYPARRSLIVVLQRVRVSKTSRISLQTGLISSAGTRR